MANPELSKPEALAKAQAYCARAEHCAADVRRKLYEWQVNPLFFDSIEEKLYEDDYLNDTRFCRAYVHDKVAYQRWGRMKIQAGLRALNLPEKTIREALENIDETLYFNNLRALIASRKVEWLDTQPAIREDKCLRFLLQRGFTYEEIKNCK